MKVLCVLAILCFSGMHCLALDREAFTFTNYSLDVRVDPGQQRLAVRGKITLRNDSDLPQRNLSLQISSTLNWSAIQFDGKPAVFVSQVYTSDIDHTGALSEAIITLAKPVAPQHTVELEIGYEGVVPQDATRLTRIGVPAEIAKQSDWDQISPSFTALRGIGYVTWYPVSTQAANLSEGSSVFEAVGRWKQKEARAEMRIALGYSGGTSDAPSEMLSNGIETKGMVTEAARGQILSLDSSFSPTGSVVPTFTIGQYSKMDRNAVSIHYLSDHKSGAEDYGLAAEETAPFVNKWFGDHREKPERKAQVVELADSSASPFESGNMLWMPLTAKDTTLLLSAIQQLTLLMLPSQRAWISHGLSSYAQVSYVQEKEGRTPAIDYLQRHRDPLVQSETQVAGADPAAHSLINSPDEFYVQAKAMNVWWMLRDMIGENALTAALHNYRASEDKKASYMQKLIEAQAHRDLEWFFDDWVYRDRGLPDFRIASVYPRQLVSGGYMVTVTVENLGDAAAEVPVTLHMQNGEASGRLVVAGKSQSSVRIQAATLPQEVVVNDGSVPERDVSNNTYRIERVVH